MHPAGSLGHFRVTSSETMGKGTDHTNPLPANESLCLRTIRCLRGRHYYLAVEKVASTALRAPGYATNFSSNIGKRSAAGLNREPFHDVDLVLLGDSGACGADAGASNSLGSRPSAAARRKIFSIEMFR
jgi:hypothetical protein